MDPFPPNISFSWDEEAISFIPITKYNFSNKDISLTDSLNHDFNDLSFFPTWQGFLDRSTGENPNYQNYMVFLMCKSSLREKIEDSTQYYQQIIGVLAVQLIDFDSLQKKNFAVVPEINNYLYLSWIALDNKFQSTNYFSILFEYYYALIRRFRKHFNLTIEGAAITIRRMRPVFWSLFNDGTKCPTITDRIIKKQSAKFKLSIMPIELFDEDIDPDQKQDHILISFKERKSITETCSIQT